MAKKDNTPKKEPVKVPSVKPSTKPSREGFAKQDKNPRRVPHPTDGRPKK